MMTADIAGRLEVPAGGDFTLDVRVVTDPPQWTMSLVGNGTVIATWRDQSPFSERMAGLANGAYVLTIEATLVSDQGSFQLVARSDIDDERKELVRLPGASTRLDMMPVVVGP